MLGSLLARLDPQRSVRARLTLLMGASGFVFCVALVLLMGHRAEQRERETVQQRLHASAQTIAHLIEQDIRSRRDELAVLAQAIADRPPSQTGEFRRLIDRVKASTPAYAWIGLADASGKVIVASDSLLEGVSVAQRPWFQQARNGVYFGDPHEAKLLAPFVKRGESGELPRFVDIAMTVDDTGGAVLGGHLYWDWAEEAIRSATSGIGLRDTQVLIADVDGNWLFTPSSVTSSDLAGYLSDEAARQPFVETLVRMSAASNGDGLVHWSVLLREPRDSAFAAVLENRREMLLWAVLAAVAFAGLTWFVAGWMARPLLALADMARSLRVSGAPSPATLQAGRTKTGDETLFVSNVMRDLSSLDALTGLLNRKRLLDDVRAVLAAVAGRGHLGGLVVMNIDDFRKLNDTQGHDAGDHILLEVTQRLRSAVGTSGSLARLGADEFALLLPDLGTSQERAAVAARVFAEQMLAVLDTPVLIDGNEQMCKASAGYLVFDGREQTSASELLKQVDLALAEAKASEYVKAMMFDRRMQDRLAEQVALEEDLARAIPTELRLVYQPQVNLDGRVIGAETLIRWERKGVGMVPPSLFIPAAEASGLIIPIGLWVMRRACETLRRWQDIPAMAHLVLAVNVSAREFDSPSYVDQVLRLLKETGIDPSRLKLELTESILASDIAETIGRMNTLRARGVRFSLDDFGTGFSSLAYLQRMPLTQLKIDQSFVKDVTVNRNDASIARTIINLGAGLELMVIAEGVETAEQHQFLVNAGCRFFQGYLFGKPMPLEEFEKLLTQ